VNQDRKRDKSENTKEEVERKGQENLKKNGEGEKMKEGLEGNKRK
jgi:hypothetical protein